ncbi:hypothetical protein [Rothia dentocariosa]|uniref:hypothetical protein n=1 Tax=Rothia dentocariosa TaxID=2047 RepID=UPI00066115DC|nr:hypothetical protein [Rothia dentocariosa]
MAKTTKPPAYSGQGKHLENAVLFIGCFVFLLLSLYLLGTYPDGGPILYAGSLVAFGIFFAIPFHLLLSKTTRKITDQNKIQK